MTQIHHLLLSRRAFLGLGVMALLPNQILRAGAQKEETLSSNVATAMRHSIENVNQPYLVFATKKEADAWLNEMSIRLKVFSNSEYERKKILINAQYEAVRSGLDPQLILGLIEVESRFRRYAISKAGARGLMQVMPFWLNYIGTPEHNLFDIRTNLRYGCTILRHYLNLENGDLFLALGRYNGSRGRAAYPDAVLGAYKKRWKY